MLKELQPLSMSMAAKSTFKMNKKTSAAVHPKRSTKLKQILQDFANFSDSDDDLQQRQAQDKPFKSGSRQSGETVEQDCLEVAKQSSKQINSTQSPSTKLYPKKASKKQTMVKQAVHKKENCPEKVVKQVCKAKKSSHNKTLAMLGIKCDFSDSSDEDNKDTKKRLNDIHDSSVVAEKASPSNLPVEYQPADRCKNSESATSARQSGAQFGQVTEIAVTLDSAVSVTSNDNSLSCDSSAQDDVAKKLTCLCNKDDSRTACGGLEMAKCKVEFMHASCVEEGQSRAERFAGYPMSNMTHCMVEITQGEYSGEVKLVTSAGNKEHESVSTGRLTSASNKKHGSDMQAASGSRSLSSTEGAQIQGQSADKMTNMSSSVSEPEALFSLDQDADCDAKKKCDSASNDLLSSASDVLSPILSKNLARPPSQPGDVSVIMSATGVSSTLSLSARQCLFADRTTSEDDTSVIIPLSESTRLDCPEVRQEDVQQNSSHFVIAQKLQPRAARAKVAEEEPRTDSVNNSARIASDDNTNRRDKLIKLESREVKASTSLKESDFDTVAGQTSAVSTSMCSLAETSIDHGQNNICIHRSLDQQSFSQTEDNKSSSLYKSCLSSPASESLSFYEAADTATQTSPPGEHEPITQTFKKERRRQESSSDDDNDAKLEAFFQSVRTPARVEREAKRDSDGELDDFIVDDSDATESDEDVSYTDVSRRLDFAETLSTKQRPPRNRKKEERLPFSQPEFGSSSSTETSSSEDSDDSDNDSNNIKGNNGRFFTSLAGAAFTRNQSPDCGQLQWYTPKTSFKSTAGRGRGFSSARHADSDLVSPTQLSQSKQATCFTTPSSTAQAGGESSVTHATFLTSLSTDTPDIRRDPESRRFISHFKQRREELSSRLFKLFNATVFDNQLPSDLGIIWNKRLLKTAGRCKEKRIGSRREALIELSVKVCDSAERVRDTLVHEMCHAAVWLLSGVREGHGPYWKHWARKANHAHPEIPIIQRCHDYAITTKYIYRCTKCGYQFGRHSKSLDTDRKVCGNCYGQFQLLLAPAGGANTQRATRLTPAPQTPRTPNRFAMFVKEKYGSVKKQGLSHKDVMKQLSKDFAEKNKIG